MVLQHEDTFTGLGACLCNLILVLSAGTGLRSELLIWLPGQHQTDHSPLGEVSHVGMSGKT